MRTLINKINFSALSQGEQTEVYRIVKKAQMSQPVSDKEQKFIEDMASRGEKSNPDQLNKAWAALVSYCGVNAGYYVSEKLKEGIVDGAFPETKYFFSLTQAALAQAIKPLGGSPDRIEIIVDISEYECIRKSPIPHDHVVDFSVRGPEPIRFEAKESN
ncbi:MAG TPA: hypothetical protein DHV48_12910 [Prolixibacteraceae bacterium]|nr:hypothetical protein [Prolixibacteraceae bacterium]